MVFKHPNDARGWYRKDGKKIRKQLLSTLYSLSLSLSLSLSPSLSVLLARSPSPATRRSCPFSNKEFLFGQRPQRGRSPVEHRGNFCPSVRSSPQGPVSGPQRPKSGPWRPDLGPWRPDLGPHRPNLGPWRPESAPWRPESGP